jgi:hypothetical protein
MLTRVSIDWSGTTDATGSFTYGPVTVDNSYPCSIDFAGQTVGNPTWLVYRAGSFIWPGQGQAVGLGPFPFHPQEQIKVVVSGARPLTVISGTLTGWKTDDSTGADLGGTNPGSVGTVQQTVPGQPQLGAPIQATMKRPYDWQVFSMAAANAIANVYAPSPPANSGLTTVMDSIFACLFQEGSTAGGINLLVQDTYYLHEKLKMPLGLQGIANTTDRIVLSDLGIRLAKEDVAAGAQLQATFDAPILSVSQYINIFGYFE